MRTLILALALAYGPVFAADSVPAPAAPATPTSTPSTPTAATPKARDIRFIVIHSPGPAWVASKSMFEQPGLGAHIAHYRQWLQEGKLVLGGPMMTGAGGGMMIPEAGIGEDEVKRHAAADPAVQSGLLTFEVRPWLIGMKK